MKKRTAIGVIAGLLVLLFVYTTLSKLLDMESFAGNMRNQHLPGWLTTMLILGLPPAEMAVVLCLLFERTQRAGFIGSLVLLTVYTIYIGTLLLHSFPRVPCPCGGIFRRMNWDEHFLFNIGVIILTILALILDPPDRKTRLFIFHL